MVAVENNPSQVRGGGTNVLNEYKEPSAPQVRCSAVTAEEVPAAMVSEVLSNSPGVVGEIDPATQSAAERLRTGRYAYRFCKRAFDIVFSLIVLVGLCWLYAIVAIAIKLDDPHGPVVFKQARVGKDGREFQMYKFRSMVTDAETRLAQLLERNEKTGPVFKLHDDPRVTRVGRVIRKVSLDELPQFVNVLKGDLSVVGPRPALPREVATYDDYQRQRLLVKQGLTCYWQTRQDRDSITFDEWVDLDLLYIRKCSAWTDFKLIVQTVGCVLTAQGH